MRLQARHLSFRLRTSSNTPSIGTSVVIEFSSQFQWKGCFPSCNLGWRSARANHTIQDKIAIWTAHQQINNEPAVGFFPTPQEDMSCKGLEDYVEAL
jgi:hypothetical protein